MRTLVGVYKCEHVLLPTLRLLLKRAKIVCILVNITVLGQVFVDKQ